MKFHVFSTIYRYEYINLQDVIYFRIIYKNETDKLTVAKELPEMISSSLSKKFSGYVL